VSTRDCSLQRRNQKLVEEAPAPFLTAKQDAELVRASKAILTEAGYTGAGTCEFLVGQDGRISFLEVNTRLQVEHPVTEEVAGIDLVREQFRIADGEELGYENPPPRGHSIEFRINGEDPGRDFLPAPGSVLTYRVPSGPGVRLDSGVEAGDVISGAFDSMLAKLIVTGRDRQQALQRARRALDEFVVEGMPTALTFHRVVVRDPAFAPADPDEPFSVHTRWIETEFDNTIEPYSGPTADADAEPEERQSLVVEVDGKRLEVSLPAGMSMGGGGGGGARKKAPKRTRGGSGGAAVSGDAVTAPMQGTVVKVTVEEGQQVAEGDAIVVIEAMKMEQPIKAHKSGTVTGLQAAIGKTVTNGAVICELTD
nr:biotin/lipoyl-binding protein [Actinomycetota bacterium]